MDTLVSAAGLVFVPATLALIAAGAILGLILGAIPGLTATMGVTLMLPVSLHLPPGAGMALLLAVYVGAVSGASTPAILLGIPGNPNAIATVRDGHAMTRSGRAGQALGAAALASLIGGLASVAVLALFAPLLAPVTLAFGPADKTMLAVLGLAAVASISSRDPAKGGLCAALGIALAMLGLDVYTNQLRMPMPDWVRGTPLQTGLPMVPLLIGVFGISQVLIDIDRIRRGDLTVPQIPRRNVFPGLSELRRLWRVTAESAGIGTFIGAIPGAGASIAVFLAYERARTLAARPGSRIGPIGDGAVAGVFAPETANNAVTGGGLLPILTLALPGDAVGAILLGALLIQGIVPGPVLFTQHPDLVLAIFLSMALGMIVVFVFQILGVRLFPLILRVPVTALGPPVLLLCLVGAFAVNGQSIVVGSFNMAVAMGFGVVGYLLRRGGYPIAPFVLGFILGPLLEQNFRLAIRQAQGNALVFVTEPIALTFLLLALVWVFWRPVALRLCRPQPS